MGRKFAGGIVGGLIGLFLGLGLGVFVLDIFFAPRHPWNTEESLYFIAIAGAGVGSLLGAWLVKGNRIQLGALFGFLTGLVLGPISGVAIAYLAVGSEMGHPPPFLIVAPMLGAVGFFVGPFVGMRLAKALSE